MKLEHPFLKEIPTEEQGISFEEWFNMYDSITLSDVCVYNPLGNKKLTVKIGKEWAIVLLPLLAVYLEVCEDCKENCSPKAKKIFIQDIEIANQLICILNSEPTEMQIDYFELDVILDAVLMERQIIESENEIVEIVEPVLEDIYKYFKGLLLSLRDCEIDQLNHLQN